MPSAQELASSTSDGSGEVVGIPVSTTQPYGDAVLFPREEGNGKDDIREPTSSSFDDDGNDSSVLHATEEEASEFQCPRIPIMVIVLLMISSMAQSFSSSCMFLFINMVLGFGPVLVTRYWMFIGYAAWFQPLIGWVSDVFVILGEKRRPLFVLCVAGNAVIHSIYCFKPAVTASFPTFVGVSMVSQLCTMGTYIPLNGLLVEVGRKDGELREESVARIGAIMSKAMVYRTTGGLIAMVLQTILVIWFSVRVLLGVSAIMYVGVMVTVMFAPRALFLRVSTTEVNFYRRIKETWHLLQESFDIKDYRSDGVCFVLVLLFVFLYTVMPDAQTVYYNYLYGAFYFDAWFYSVNNCIGYVGSIAGAYVFSVWMDQRAKAEAQGGVRTSIFFIFVVGSISWALAYVTNIWLCTGFITETIGIPAGVYIPIDNFFVSMFVRFAFMPTIAMAAEHAPKNFEATAFEVFSVASIGGGSVSMLITSFIAEGLQIDRPEYKNLWILLVISIVCKLLPIPVAYFLPSRRLTSELEDDQATSTTLCDCDEGCRVVEVGNTPFSETGKDV